MLQYWSPITQDTVPLHRTPSHYTGDCPTTQETVPLHRTPSHYTGHRPTTQEMVPLHRRRSHYTGDCPLHRKPITQDTFLRWVRGASTNWWKKLNTDKWLTLWERFYKHSHVVLISLQTKPRTQSSSSAVVACSTNNALFVLQATNSHGGGLGTRLLQIYLLSSTCNQERTKNRKVNPIFFLMYCCRKNKHKNKDERILHVMLILWHNDSGI